MCVCVCTFRCTDLSVSRLGHTCIGHSSRLTFALQPYNMPVPAHIPTRYLPELVRQLVQVCTTPPAQDKRKLQCRGSFWVELASVAEW